MPDLLLELRSEEIPARMQRKAAGDLKKMMTDGLVEAGLTYEAAREYWTPRRLALDIRGVTARSKDISEEIKGPSTKAPEQAVQGFLRKAGLSSIAEAHVHADPKKGDFYVAHISKPGRAAEEIIAELVPDIIRDFPWPKSMRWGPASAKSGSLRWVRPLQSILCTFGPETEEPVVVDFEIDGIRSGNITYGHRFHAPGAISVRRFDDYVAKLEAAKVVLDADRRKQIILSDARNLAFANGLNLVEDEGLLEEVSGLVEWPVVLMGEFEQDFLAIPAEVIRLTIRANQKCFVTRPHAVGEELSNRFILTANIEASDGGKEIAHGNGKVVRARLSDALYFWKTDQGDLPDLDQLQASAEKFGLDLKKPLDQRMARLDHLGVTFHAKLGTQSERVERIAQLAEELAPIVASAISPLEGEMPSGGKEGRPEGVADPREAPTSALPSISPSRGEIGQSSNDDLLQIVRRVKALGSFLDTEDGKNLLSGTKRAANILAAEEKKKTTIAENVEPALFREEAEKSLFAAVNQAEKEAGQAIHNEDFSAAMLALSALREPVDSFFERVLVNDEDQAVRANRLALLARIRAATDQVADFSKIAG